MMYNSYNPFEYLRNLIRENTVKIFFREVVGGNVVLGLVENILYKENKQKFNLIHINWPLDVALHPKT